MEVNKMAQYIEITSRLDRLHINNDLSHLH